MRNKKLRRVFCILLSVALMLTSFSGTAFALVDWPQGVYTVSEGACVMDADSGVVLYGKNQDDAYYPASITKVMTALIVLENCSDLNEMVTFSAAAVAYEEDNATLIGASEGDQLTVRDCLYALLFASANEVANALAEHVGAKHPELRTENESNRQIFVRMMNEKAAELGCKGTHFNNPSGLTDPEHYTTAYDMCLILAAAVKNDSFVEIESHTYWTHAPIKRYPDPDDPWNTVYPRHQMLKRNSSRYYPGVFAGKTGYTMTAGNTLVTACRKDDMTLVVTVLNAHNSHYDDTRRLLNFGYEHFQSLKISEYDTANRAAAEDFTVGGLPLLETTTLGIDPDSRITLPKGADFSEVTKSLDTSAQDGAAARIFYAYGDRTVGSALLKTEPLGASEALRDAAEDPLLKDTAAETAGALPGEDVSAAAGVSDAAGAADSAQADAAAEAESPDEADNTAQIAAASGGQADGTASGEAAQQGERAVLDETGVSPEGETQVGAGGTAGTENPDGFLGLPPLAVMILKVLGAGLLLLIAGAVFMLYKEKKEARARARRRQQRLRHTRDLTQTQSIHMDLLIQQRLRKRKRKRKR